MPEETEKDYWESILDFDPREMETPVKREALTPEKLVKLWREDLLSQSACEFGVDVMVYAEPILPDGWDWMVFDPDEFNKIPGAIRVTYNGQYWEMVIS